MGQRLTRGVTMSGMLICSVLILGGCGSSAASQEAANAETGEDSAPATNEAAPPAVASQTGCQTDADCVPDACCHAKGCVSAAAAPAGCDDVMCTSECKDGTMDCGKGACACTDGTCGVKWSE